MRISRRTAMGTMAALYGSTLGAVSSEVRMATFSVDVTPPLGCPLLGNASATPPVKTIEDPLFVKGFVLLGAGPPLVLATIDWCEIRNDAYDRWRDGLAEAAGTTREHVLISCIHQHDAPLADLEAQRILEGSMSAHALIDLEFHERCVRETAEALRHALKTAQPISHLGLGKARVEKVASNRRYVDRKGQVRFDRSSMSGADPEKSTAPDGTIDPWLRTLSFWNGEQAICALHVYAVHPMSYWGRGHVSADFPGLARKLRQLDDSRVFQIYASGCSGNVTAGKYNDGSPANRAILAERLHAAMVSAWNSTERRPLRTVTFRNVRFRLEPRNTPGFTVPDLTKLLQLEDRRKRSLAAMGLSWRKRADAGSELDMPVLDFGDAQIVLLPGESYVEYQLRAQELCPDQFVMAVGYGDCATGYVPTESAWRENDSNLNPWCWVAPGAEAAMNAALRQALAPGNR